ncbi:MAG: hypothetical protein VXW26_17445, partial [SAR324 cluster bacterium]|nr:hypothetical protein [SAR324 cluster bacterium]
PLKHQIVSMFMFFDLKFRPTGSSFPTLFIEKRFFDEGSDSPRPPQRKTPNEIPYKKTCLTTPYHFSKAHS